ncbi:hypothetical protein ABIB00_004189 [Bradyrhizobium sp. LB14.3]|uniref:hypothetical protein n=1 Tax=Bradyrhizobium sp. LB14.3 TaxID=3156328 RepID=UPI003394329E
MMRDMQSESTLALIAKRAGNSNRECRLCRNTMPRSRRNARVYFLAEDWKRLDERVEGLSSEIETPAGQYRPSQGSELSGPHQHDEHACSCDVTGDGLSLAVRVGAAIDKDVASVGFCTPGSIFKSGSASQVVPCDWLDRGRPAASQCVNAKRIRRLRRNQPYRNFMKMTAGTETRTSAITGAMTGSIPDRPGPLL